MTEPVLLQIPIYTEQEPIVQLTTALFELLNNQQFDTLPDQAKARVLNHVADMRINGGRNPQESK